MEGNPKMTPLVIHCFIVPRWTLQHQHVHQNAQHIFVLKMGKPPLKSPILGPSSYTGLGLRPSTWFQTLSDHLMLRPS